MAYRSAPVFFRCRPRKPGLGNGAPPAVHDLARGDGTDDGGRGLSLHRRQSADRDRDPYRKYYGLKMAAFLFMTFAVAMAGASLVVEFVLGALGLSSIFNCE